MVDAAVADHVVEEDLQSALLSLVEQTLGILVGPVAGGHLVVVGDVIACIAEGRLEERVDPDPVHAQALDVVQLLEDALQVADAVSVRVEERLRIDLVEHGLVEPGRAGGDSDLARDLGGVDGQGLVLGTPHRAEAQEAQGEEAGEVTSLVHVMTPDSLFRFKLTLAHIVRSARRKSNGQGERKVPPDVQEENRRSFLPRMNANRREWLSPG